MDPIDEVFESATVYVRNVSGRLKSSDLLYFYARYKQVNEGVCNTPKPGFFDFQGKQKWEAWKSLGNMSKEEAMNEYVSQLSQIEPAWEEQMEEGTVKKSTGLGTAVSTMVNTDSHIPDDEKSFFDWLKDGETDHVRNILTRDRKIINLLDEEGMAPIHWACDRGYVDMVELLIKYDADVNIQDEEGQTPLHYAACCEHLEVVRMLLENGADCKICDNSGCIPECESQEITDMFDQYR